MLHLFTVSKNVLRIKELRREIHRMAQIIISSCIFSHWFSLNQSSLIIFYKQMLWGTIRLNHVTKHLLYIHNVVVVGERRRIVPNYIYLYNIEVLTERWTWSRRPWWRSHVVWATSGPPPGSPESPGCHAGTLPLAGTPTPGTHSG